jgi:hypothetical protein
MTTKTPARITFGPFEPAAWDESASAPVYRGGELVGEILRHPEDIGGSTRSYVVGGYEVVLFERDSTPTFSIRRMRHRWGTAGRYLTGDHKDAREALTAAKAYAREYALPPLNTESTAGV